MKKKERQEVYRCDDCRFATVIKSQYDEHMTDFHATTKATAKKSRHSRKQKPVKKITKSGRKLRQEKSQHIPRPDNFDLSGCGIEIYYEHLTYIPDFEDVNLTVEYLDKERVCKKCRRVFKLDEAILLEEKKARRRKK